MMWHDGSWADKAQVSAFSHAVNYSCGVFDTVRLYDSPGGPAFFRLDDHVRRLYSAMDAVGFSTRFSPAQVCKAAVQLAQKSALRSAYVRINAFLPQEQLRVYPENRQASLAMVIAPMHYTGKSFENGLSAHVSAMRKASCDVLPSGVKFSANYLSSYLALQQARDSGFDEALLLDSRGFVAEASAQNLFMARNGVLYTPSARSEILPGVTRDSVMVLARDLGLPVEVTDVSVRQLLAADEVFLCGTATEIMPVTRLGKRKLAVGPLTRTLKATFDDAVHGRHGFSKKWLSYV
ncbi:branched-chain-amino-acid transaminase [Candidatus Micrarchaeota archaeon]|nr:branched-chain-amino-acid transaminase [Candidatus Micrarchaeota archaeon]